MTGQQGQAYYASVDRGEIARVDEAMVTNDERTDHEVLRQLRPIALPQVPLLPPRFGYGHPVVEVQDCFDQDRNSAERYDFSGSQGGYSGTSTPSMGSGVW